MNRVSLVLICLLVILFTACTLPAPRIEVPEPTSPPPSEPAASAETEADSMMTEAPAVTEAENFATEALAAMLAEPTTTPTATTTTRLPQIQANPQPTQIPSPEPVYRFLLQSGTPAMTSNFVNPGAGCNWMGVGGQVFGKDEKPIPGLIAEVEGTLDGKPVLFLALTGSSSVLGPGGFEITLANRSIASQGTLTLQLFDLNGTPQSKKIPFDTIAGEESCEKNLIIMNFSEIGTSTQVFFFPYMPKDAPGR